MERGNNKIRLLIGVGTILFAVIIYYSSVEVNPNKGEEQRIALTEEQEITTGLQALPQMAKQHGGLHTSNEYQILVDQVGQKLVDNSIARQTGYKYDFHLLADDQTINAFALPRGQIFITYALFSKLQNKDQLAGILGHEIGHVVFRYGSERMVEKGLIQGIINGGAIGIDPSTAQGTAKVVQILNMKYGREDELKSDELGVQLMMNSGYRAQELIPVMDILKAAAGPNRIPERMSTHPEPKNRKQKIRESIERYQQELQLQ